MSFSSLITPLVSTFVSFVMNNNEFQETIIHIVGNDSHICLDSNLPRNYSSYNCHSGLEPSENVSLSSRCICAGV